MKIIGRIEPEFIRNSDEVINAEYVNGRIIAFTPQEVRVLALIQEANRGNSWDWTGRYTPDDIMLDDAFMCIYRWVTAKFMVNDLQSLVNDLKDTLEDIEK